jgi:hypothetical protein
VYRIGITEDQQIKIRKKNINVPWTTSELNFNALMAGLRKFQEQATV